MTTYINPLTTDQILSYWLPIDPYRYVISTIFNFHFLKKTFQMKVHANVCWAYELWRIAKVYLPKASFIENMSKASQTHRKLNVIMVMS